uniref:Secreted protein n=1 Tax=Schistocephalus solidus TaxID=70667 RepID=A0A0X3P235_SCHSO
MFWLFLARFWVLRHSYGDFRTQDSRLSSMKLFAQCLSICQQSCNQYRPSTESKFSDDWREGRLVCCRRAPDTCTLFQRFLTTCSPGFFNSLFARSDVTAVPRSFIA